MSQNPAQIVSKSAIAPNPSIDPQYPAFYNAANANNPSDTSAVSIAPLAAVTVLRPTAPIN